MVRVSGWKGGPCRWHLLEPQRPRMEHRYIGERDGNRRASSQMGPWCWVRKGSEKPGGREYFPQPPARDGVQSWGEELTLRKCLVSYTQACFFRRANLCQIYNQFKNTHKQNRLRVMQPPVVFRIHTPNLWDFRVWDPFMG